MRRLVVVILVFTIGLVVPASVEAANNQQRRAKPKDGKKKPKANQVRVKPRTPRGVQAGSIGGTRARRVAAEPAYDDVDEGFDDEAGQDFEPEPEPPIRMGWVQGRRTHYRPDGRMAPVAPGYRGFEPFVGGKAKTMGKVGMVVTTTLAVGIAVFAAVMIGGPAIHNFPQIFGFK